MSLRWLVLLLACTCGASWVALPPSSAHAQSTAQLADRWEGAAEGGGALLGLALELVRNEEGWGGRFLIPAEGVDLPLSDVRVRGDSLVVPLAPGRELRAVLVGDSLVGELEVQGRSMPLILGRAGSAAAERLVGEVRAVADAARPAPLEKTAAGEALSSVNQEALDRLLSAANASHSHSLVVLREGDLVGAWHAGGERRLIETMSVTKSILNLAVGRLVTLGAIESTDESVGEYYPEWSEGERSRITIRHLLEHTSGIDSPQPTGPIYASEDFVQFALDAEQVAAPGTEITYNNNAANLLAGLAGRAVGERLDRFLARDLFAYLDIHDFRWSLDDAGNLHGMSGLQLHAADLAKLGQLVLQRGRWDGEQLISEAWFEESLRPGTDFRDDVGLLWWLLREEDEIVGYWANGYLGQYLVIYPDEGLVAVRLVGQTPGYDAETDGFRDFHQIVRILTRGE